MKNKSEEKEKFSKEQILNSKNYAKNKDVLTAILKDNEFYAKEEVDLKIKEFLKRRIK